MDPDRAASFAENLLDEEKLKDLTAADGTLPGGACILTGSCSRGVFCPANNDLPRILPTDTFSCPPSPHSCMILDTGMTPEMLSKLVSNPELMVLMQNPKLQEIMKKVSGSKITDERVPSSSVLVSTICCRGSCTIGGADHTPREFLLGGAT